MIFPKQIKTFNRSFNSLTDKNRISKKKGSGYYMPGPPYMANASLLIYRNTDFLHAVEGNI